MRPLLLIFVATLFSCEQSGPTHRGFDSADWKKSNEQGRGSMTDSLIKDCALMGKTKGEVIKMLGDPDAVYYDCHFSYSVDKSKASLLGLEGSRFSYLDVVFDSVTCNNVQEVVCHD